MKQFLRFTFLTALLSLVLLSGCKDEVTTKEIPGVNSTAFVKNDNYSLEYKFADGVIIIDKSTVGEIVKVEHDSILYISKGGELSKLIKENSILNSEVSDRLPYGLGNKVISITDAGPSLKCVTTVAPLDEIFEVFKLDGTIPMIEDMPATITDDNGNQFEVKKVKMEEVNDEASNTRATLGSPEALAITLGYNTGGNGGFVTGTLYIGCLTHINVDISEKKFEFSVEPTVGVSAKLGAHGTKEFVKDKKLFTRNIFTGVCQAGPVTLRPYVDIDFTWDLEANGEIMTEFKKFVSCKTGFNQNGVIFENTTGTVGDASCIHGLNVNGSLECFLKAGLKLGMGLYTKNIAVGIEPMLKIGPTIECDLSSANTWRLDPTFNIKLLAKAEGYCLVQLFGMEFWTEQMDFVEQKLAEWSWPLLPKLKDGTLSVKKKDANSGLIFEGKYGLTGGLLAKFQQIKPGYKILRAGDLLKTGWTGSSANMFADSDHTFEITGLDYDIHYTCRPMLQVGPFMLENDGTVFSTASPTAAITEIVQTDTYYDATASWGDTYDYAFPYYVNCEIIGTSECSEWGLYTPDAHYQEDVHMPNELKDGRVTQYWTMYTNSTSASTGSQCPYAILKKDSKAVYYDPYPTTLSVGRQGTRSGAVQKSVHSGNLEDSSKGLAHLDSIVYIDRNTSARIVKRFK